MTVKEVIAILSQCDEDRMVYVQDIDGTAQPVAAIGDLAHVGSEDLGVKIPDDIYMMAARQFAELELEDDDGPPDPTA